MHVQSSMDMFYSGTIVAGRLVGQLGQFERWMDASNVRN